MAKRQSRAGKAAKTGVIISNYAPINPDEVPNVVGMYRIDAINTLIQAGYDYLVVYTGGTQEQADIVADQQVNENVITILVYTAPVVQTLPNVIGMHKTQAKAALEAAGFTLYTEYSSYPDGFFAGSGNNPGPNTGLNTVAEVRIWETGAILSPGDANPGTPIFCYAWGPSGSSHYSITEYGFGTFSSGELFGKNNGPAAGGIQFNEQSVNFITSFGLYGNQQPYTITVCTLQGQEIASYNGYVSAYVNDSTPRTFGVYTSSWQAIEDLLPNTSYTINFAMIDPDLQTIVLYTTSNV